MTDFKRIESRIDENDEKSIEKQSKSVQEVKFDKF